MLSEPSDWIEVLCLVCRPHEVVLVVDDLPEPITQAPCATWLLLFHVGADLEHADDNREQRREDLLFEEFLLQRYSAALIFRQRWYEGQHVGFCSGTQRSEASKPCISCRAVDQCTSERDHRATSKNVRAGLQDSICTGQDGSCSLP